VSARGEENEVAPHLRVPEDIIDGRARVDEQAILLAPGDAGEALHLLHVDDDLGPGDAVPDVHEEVRPSSEEGRARTVIGQDAVKLRPGSGRQVPEALKHGTSMTTTRTVRRPPEAKPSSCRLPLLHRSSARTTTQEARFTTRLSIRRRIPSRHPCPSCARSSRDAGSRPSRRFQAFLRMRPPDLAEAGTPALRERHAGMCR
jgi:hypothetical protein